MTRLLFVVLAAACGSTPPTPPPTRAVDPRADACSSFDEKACSARPDCHPEFGWPQECSGNHCAPAPFQYAGCHVGKTVNCTKPTTNCDEPDPPCASHGAYRVQWIGTCHEGCVRATDCAAE